MAHSDLELAYLLTAYGEQVYGLALARTKDADQAEAILQKIFIELVNFPPCLEEEALLAALLKKAKKLSPAAKEESAAPAPLPEALEEELLALMKEARDHEGILPPPSKKWTKIHTIAASCLGFLLILGLIFGLIFGGSGQKITDESGSDSLLKPAPQQQAAPPAEKDPAPAQPKPEAKLYPFEIIESESCKTYLKLSAFIEAIAERSAAGYGVSYYNAQPLLLLPSRLPDGALFRHLYLNPQTGNYSYSFQFEAGKTLYLLDFEVRHALPASAPAIEEAISALREEKTARSIKGATLLATFGKDQISATLSAPESQEPIDEKIAKKFLDRILLERCSMDNPFLEEKN